MFSIAFRYLTGRVVATDPGCEDRVEWPPHPGRFYMALVAAHYEGRPAPDPAERQCLEWLEAQPAPEVVVPTAAERVAVTCFVPVNDRSNPMNDKGVTQPPFASHIPIGRVRQGRRFPSASLLEDDTVYLVWRESALPAHLRDPFDGLLERVTRVGHSSSLVHASIDDEPPPESTLLPRDVGATHRLRVAAPGRLAELDVRFRAGLRPSPGRSTGYGPPHPPRRDTVASEFDPALTVLSRVREDRGEPGAESTVALTTALRGALMHWCPTQPVPAVLSGHAEGGGRAERTHVALLALPNAGHRHHADGRILGLAVAVPRAASPEEREAVSSSLRRWLAPDGGQGLLRLEAGPMTFQVEDRLDPPWSLRAETWTASDSPHAVAWASVTPVVLDRYPKRRGNAEAIVAAACTRIGLPEPRDVTVGETSWHRGAPPARRFRAYPARSGPRPQRHVLLVFDQPVRGPIILGAGRYFGYGLCRPWTEGVTT